MSQIVRPEIANYYNYPLEDLEKHELRLNALYFSLTELIGLKCINQEERRQKALKQFGTGITKLINDGGVGAAKSSMIPQLRETANSQGRENSKQRDNLQMPVEETFYKSFGKIEKPFGEFNQNYLQTLPYYFEFSPKSKSFSLRNLPYTVLANKFKEFKEKDQLNEAIESCRMRSCIRRKLLGGEAADTPTIADLCQIYLEKENYDLAKQAAIKALQVIHPMHAEAIKFYCILM